MLQSRHSYTPPKNENGQRDFSVEEKLSKLESFLSQKWDQISTGFVPLARDSSARKMLALFMATMIVRHPDKIEEIKKFNEHMTKIVRNAPRDVNGTPQVSILDKLGKPFPVDLTRWKTIEPLCDLDFRRIFSEIIPSASRDLMQMLLRKRWAVIAADTPSFCTSDRPVAIGHPTAKTFGVDTDGTTLLFPLSPTRLLILDDRTDFADGSYYQIQPNSMGALGSAVLFYTHRFLISNVDPFYFINEIVRVRKKVMDRRDSMWPIKLVKPGRNLPCRCNSGRKWKHCCGAAEY